MLYLFGQKIGLLLAQTALLGLCRNSAWQRERVVIVPVSFLHGGTIIVLAKAGPSEPSLDSPPDTHTFGFPWARLEPTTHSQGLRTQGHPTALGYPQLLRAFDPFPH